MAFDPTAARAGSVFSDVPNYQAAWVCYINGIEVPIVGFQTQCQIWQVPSFTIHCVPDPLIQRLGTEDRIPVQIFYLDHWVTDRPTFRLLIDGEIVGWQFSSSTGARTLAFSCLSHIQIFQQLYFFYMTNADDIVASQSPEVRAQGFATPGLLYPYALFHQGLLSTSAQQDAASPVYNARGEASPPSTTVTTTDPPAGGEGAEDTAQILCAYELVTNVIKGVISSKVPNDRRAVPMMNFFARYIRKTRFHNRWVRLPLLEDAAALNDRKGVFPIFNAARNDQALIAMQRQVVSQVGSSGPVWNLFQQVLGLVYMEIAMIPNPVCVQVKLTPLAPMQPEEGRILRPLYDSEPLTTFRWGLISTDSTTTDPLSRQAEANVAAAARLSRTAPNPGRNVEAFLRDVQAPGPPPVGEGVRLAQDQDATRRIAQVADREAADHTAAVAAEHTRLVGQRQQELSSSGARDLSVTPPSEPIRLAQYFVKPNFFFGEVPSCNVIMPSMIDSWTYDESYINQPTRIYVNDSVMTRALRASGNNREFMLHALTVGWPEEAGALMRHHVGSEDGTAPAGGAAHGTESGRNLLVWPEEFFKGPVTARAEIPAWFQMLQQFANGNGSGGAPGPSGTPAPNPAYTPPVPGAGVLRAGVPGAAEPADPIFSPTAGQVTSPGAGVLAPAGAAAPAPTPAPTVTQDPVQAATEQARLNTGPAPVAIPESTQYATTSPQTARTGLSPALMALPAFAMPVQITRGSSTFTVLSLNASRHARFWLSRNSGLDPANYIPPKKRAPWPFVRPRTSSTRRGRNTPPAPGYSEIQKMAMVVTLLKPACRDAFPGLTEDQLTAVAFGFAWITFRENGVNGYYAWAIGNGKQYPEYPSRPWTINPFDRLAYQAARTKEEAARAFIADLQSRYASSLGAMLTGSLAPELRDFLRTQNKLENPYWASVAPIRPDLLYINLGYVQYYADRIPNALTRAQIGISRTSSQTSVYTRIKNLIDTNAVPALGDYEQDVPVEYQRPLFRPEDAGRIGTRTGPGRFRAGNGGAAPGGSGVGASTSNGAEAAEGDEFSKLFEIYAENEYLKQRYAQRNAGASMRFNPFIVIGFPAMLFDSMSTRMHCVGYVQGLGHNAFVGSGGSSMGTTVRMSFCRTLQEFINDVRTDASRFNGRITSAPAEIIEEIRVVIQDDTNAEEFYQKLLYGGAPPSGSPACFRWERAMGYAQGIAGEAIYIDGETNSTLVREEQAARETRRAANAEGPSDGAGVIQTPAAPPATQGDRNVAAVQTESENNLDPNRELSPRLNTAYADAFDNYHIAMQLAARPVCTLEQYIRFWHGGRTINDLIGANEVAEPRHDFSYASVRVTDITRRNADGTNTRGNVGRPAATYYGRIFKLRMGPGDPPDEGTRGYTSGPNIQPSATNVGVGVTYPETRADWDSVLLEYRQRIRQQAPTT